jgi:cytochrome c2
MTEREAALMADYIKKVYVSDDIPRFFEYELSGVDISNGQKLFTEYECSACHIINGKGGYVGPQLDDVGNRLEAGWIYSWLRNPLKYKPETIHPDYGFSDDEARQLAAFMTSKRGQAK